MKKCHNLFIILILLFSCGRYNSKFTEEKMSDCNSICIVNYPRHTYLKYQNGIKTHLDTETYTPLGFEMHLPPNIRYYQIHSTNTFELYYSGKEVIVIKTPYLEDVSQSNRTSFTPSTQELKQFLGEGFNTHNKYDLSKIDAFKSRTHRMFVNSTGVTFCLYNIKRRNIDEYTDFIDTFKEIPNTEQQ